MTRETKIGLIVATSFLGLVGVVVAARLSRSEEKSAADSATIASIKPLKNVAKPGPAKNDKDAGKPTPVPAGKEPGQLTLTVGDAQPKLDPTLPVDLNNSKEPPIQPPPISTPNILEEEHQRKMRELEAEKRKLDGMLPLPKLDPKGSAEPPPLGVAANDSKPSLPSPSASPPAISPPAISPPLVAPSPSVKLDPLPSAPAPTPTTPPSPPVASGVPPIKITEAPAPGLASPVPAQLAANSGNPKPPPLDPKPPVSPPVTPPSNTAPPVTPPSGTAPAPPPLSNEPPIPLPSGPPGVAPVNIGAGKPVTSPAPEPKALDPVPPIGAKPASSSPPITINPDPSKGPQVKSYDVEQYVTKADDTSFARISQKLYGSDRYARALAAFNKDHPFASEGLKQEPARLQPGQAVYFPPVHVLESKYPWAIGEAAPAPGGNSGARPITIGGAEPLVPSVGNPNTMSGPPPGTRPPQTASVNSDNTRNYTVREGGEHILEIARTVLRSSSRWIEVYRLNPSVRPEYPIPAGTVLRLPAN
ncbi:MAG: hypothetical protein FJ271_29185 [Planctomycetes bacterium]|nr:hypothetical protein [Planctomycetota bacterium]